jgi:hypothetical protein
MAIDWARFSVPLKNRKCFSDYQEKSSAIKRLDPNHSITIPLAHARFKSSIRVLLKLKYSHIY